MQTWNAEAYARHARFVSDLGNPVVELLAPTPGERILDLGCGDGVLTKKLAELGCDVVGVDSSPQFVAAARKLGLRVVQADVTEMDIAPEFDAVFSNAVLHWIKNADAVIHRVARALRSRGRFIAEMGGQGCVQTIVTALVAELDRRGHDGQAAIPWYFPSVQDYGARLSAAGFEVRYIALISRPTAVPDMLGWLETFSGYFTAVLQPQERQDYLRCVRDGLRPHLCDAKGNWTADYVRLRFAAHLTR